MCSPDENNINYRWFKSFRVIYKSSLQFIELQFNFWPEKALKINSLCLTTFAGIHQECRNLFSSWKNNELPYHNGLMPTNENRFF